MKIITIFVLVFFAAIQVKAMEGKAITKEIEVESDIRAVWEKWATEDGCRSFFAADCKIELKPGGAYEMYFIPDAEPGSRGSEGCKVLSFLPYEMFSFSWNAPPSFPEIRNSGDNTWVVVQLEETGDNSTLVTLTHLGWQEGGDWDEVYKYFDAAWSKVLEWLKESCRN